MLNARENTSYRLFAHTTTDEQHPRVDRAGATHTKSRGADATHTKSRGAGATRTKSRGAGGPAAAAARRRAWTRRAMFWGLRLEPGRWTPYVPPPDVDVRLHVSQIALRGDVEDGDRVVVKMRCETDEAVLAGVDASMRGDDDEDDDEDDDSFEKEEYRVCVLIGGRCESQGVDLVLDEYAEFTVEGKCGCDLTGYYMPEFSDEGDDDADDDEDGMMPGFYDDSDDEEIDSDLEDVDIDDSEGDSEDEDDSEDDSEDDDDDEDDSEEDSEDDEPVVTKKGGVKIQEIKEEKKRPAEEKPAKTPEPKKQAVEPKKQVVEPKKKPDTPKRVHKNGMEIINTFASKNANAKVAAGGKKVAMKYIGKLPSGKIFDQTKGNATFTFRLGVGEVIKGWDVGVEGMREGDKRTLIIPSAMGYGKKGIKGVIPGGSALHFDVELIKVF